MTDTADATLPVEAITPPDGPTPATATPDAPAADAYIVGETPDGLRVLAATAADVWTNADTPVWVENKGPETAIPWSYLNTSYAGKLIIDAEPAPMPKPGEIRDRIMSDLGWDDESTRRMAEARHRVDPGRYPTVEDAMPADAAPPAPAATAP